MFFQAIPPSLTAVLAISGRGWAFTGDSPPLTYEGRGMCSRHSCPRPSRKGDIMTILVEAFVLLTMFLGLTMWLCAACERELLRREQEEKPPQQTTRPAQHAD